MLLRRRQHLIAALLVSLVAFSSVSLAKSVNLISDFVTGRPLERSARFRWIVERDYEAPVRHEESVDDEGQMPASRWEPRTLGHQHVPQPVETQQQQESQLEPPDGSSEKVAEDGDNIEESFNVLDKETSEAASEAVSANTDPALTSGAVSTSNGTVQEATQNVLTGRIQKDTQAPQQETAPESSNGVVNQTNNQAALNASNSNVTSQAPQVQIVSINQNYTTALNVDHASGNPKNDARKSSDLSSKMEGEASVTMQARGTPVESSSNEAHTSTEPPTSESANEAQQINQSSPGVNPQSEHFSQASQVLNELGGVQSKSSAPNRTEEVKPEVSLIQSALESIARGQNQTQIKGEEQTDPSRSSGTTRKEPEAQPPQRSNPTSSPDDAQEVPSSTTEVASSNAPQEAIRTGSSGPDSEAHSGDVQAAPPQEATQSTPQEVSPELLAEVSRQQSATVSPERAPSANPEEIRPATTQVSLGASGQEEHSKPEELKTERPEKSVNEEASKGATENAQTSADGGQMREQASPLNELAREQLQSTPASDNSLPEAHLSDNSIGQHRQEPDEIAEEEHQSYRLDVESCHNVPSAELKETIQLILDTLASENCSSVLGARELKLRPATNSRILGHVMEVSSMPVDLRQLLLIQSTRISCLSGASESKVQLYFEHELSDQWLASRWRLHSKLRLDELPVEMLRSSSSSSASRSRHFKRGVSSGVGKCERFKLETGEFYLELKALKLGATYEVAPNSQQTGAQVAIGTTGESVGEPAPELHDRRSTGAHPRPSVRLIALRPVQLFLEHGLKLDADLVAGSTSSGRRPEQTAQILHSRNDHYRRNNWLLDLYGNWLKHEYRGQLAQLFGRQAAGAVGQPLAACFE